MALFGWMGNVHLVDLVGFWEIDGLVGVGKLRPVALRSQETTARAPWRLQSSLA